MAPWRKTSIALGIVPLAVVLVTATQHPDVSEKAVVKAAAGYVASYQQQLTSILAEEEYTQQVVRQVPRDAAARSFRRLRSEVFFMFAPATNDWMAIRDVTALDGAALGERPDVKEALQKFPAHQVAARFKEYNSRYNIGRVFRNFNEPTLSLLVLDENHRHRFSFDRRRVERVDGDTLVTLAFTEKQSPTLIYDPRRGRVFSKGEFVVEAGSGRVRRALLVAKIDALRLKLTTTYSRGERLGLGMWVPTVFREEYEYGVAQSSNNPDVGTEYEHIVCEARYSNFRRFETSVRIK